MLSSPGWGGGRLGLNHARMCVSKIEGNGSLFRLQVNEMNERMSFKMGVKFAVQVYMGRIFQKYCMKQEAEMIKVSYKRYEDRPN